jgi:Zn-dependent protease/CBS domain-containing protein
VRWSYRVARVAGIGIYVHATFLILLAWVAFSGYQQGGRAAAIGGLLFILALFAIVVLHEFGHALTARRFGIPTRDITLLPIGGVARLERMPREPRQELLIAIAGPAVNIALAALIYLLLVATGRRPELGNPLSPVGAFVGDDFLTELLNVNVWLAEFNLIPAFPMDGGRVLRALLAMRSGNYAQATAAAARVGRFFALVFAVIGLFVAPNPILVFIALFVWLGAAGEAATEQTTATLDGVPLQRVMITDMRTLSPGDPLERGVQYILAGFQQDFPVVDEWGGVVGVLTRARLVKALAERGPQAPVGEVMHRGFQTADPDEPIEQALARLRACDCNALPVVRGRTLLGLLTLDNVGEYVMIQMALKGSRV